MAERWASTFIYCAADTVERRERDGLRLSYIVPKTLIPTAPLATRLWETFTFLLTKQCSYQSSGSPYTSAVLAQI